MKAIDYALAWILFIVGPAAILIIEIRHPAGAVLDTPFLWILVAMLNMWRLRNGYGVKGLRVSCIGDNLSALVAEIVRFKMFGPLM